MESGRIHKLIRALEAALSTCELTLGALELEALAVRVHRIMSAGTRQFHTLDHVFAFLGKGDALFDLAAIFHDLVYIQVDAGLPDELADLLNPYVCLECDHLRLREAACRDKKNFLLACRIFDKNFSEALDSKAGMNEFLSALLMILLLESNLDDDSLLELMLALEASIPFRPTGTDGQGPFSRLEQILRALVAEGQISWEAERLEKALHRAVAFANFDVSDFAMKATEQFLSNTWRLMPELNTALRRQGAYTIKEYRKALQGMEGFFASLRPETIFHSWQAVPDEASMKDLQHQAQLNLSRGREYLQAKLLAAASLEALAELSGGDAPISLFMGDLPHSGLRTDRLEDHLPGDAPLTWKRNDETVYLLLKDGRLNEVDFDLQNSPLALFLYRRLTAEAFAKRVEDLKAWFRGELDALGFWSGWDSKIRQDLADACAVMVPTRTERLTEISAQALA